MPPRVESARPADRGRAALGTRGRLTVVLAVVGVCLLVVEGASRALGLHRPVLYEVTAYGYRVQPGQDLVRFGNRVFYNRQGLRSETIADRPAPVVARILCLGDSITNGGTSTAQHDTYPYMLERQLRAHGLKAEVLNASAGGWAIENEEGWLRANTAMGASIVILEVASHDLFQPAAAGAIVGRHPSFPDRPPALASEQLWVRYLLPRLSTVRTEDPGVTLTGRAWADVQRVLASIGRIEAMVREGGGRLMILRVRQPSTFERPDALSQRADDALAAWVAGRDVPIADPSPLVEARGGAAVFRDGLHPNPAGNAVLAEVLLPIVVRMLDASGTGRGNGAAQGDVSSRRPGG